MSSKKTVLALGADIKNRFLVANGRKLRFGPDINDLGDAANYERFQKEVKKAVGRLKPGVIACDMHPGYFSTKFAKALTSLSSSIEPVQHHHAHIASVISEHKIKGPVIGVSFDGTGFGTDGNMWGGEFLLVEGKSFKRLAHLKYNKMPGGDKVVKEPWRMALSILGKSAAPLLKGVKKEEISTVLAMMEKDINSPLSSSAGRLFDAAAALLGVCQFASYEAEGPIKLESMCEEGVNDVYRFRIIKYDNKYIIDFTPVFLNMAADTRKEKNNVIATKFHNSMARAVVETGNKISRNTGVKKIVLSGGVFQNKFLFTRIIRQLEFQGFEIFTNKKLPVNDLNISLGQYYVSCCTGKN